MNHYISPEDNELVINELNSRVKGRKVDLATVAVEFVNQEIEEIKEKYAGLYYYEETGQMLTEAQEQELQRWVRTYIDYITIRGSNF